jgi:hypothetical protein
MREGVDAEAIQQRRSGIAVDVETSEVLRSDMHGPLPDGKVQENTDATKKPSAIDQNQEGSLRALWQHLAVACSPYRQQSIEQRAIQLTDLVRHLSYEDALARMEGDNQTAAAVSRLRQACEDQRVLSVTSDALSEIWRSARQEGEAKERRMDYGYWRTVGASPLAINHPGSRIGMLRGAGNAIVPQAAQAFIETYLEIIA